VTTSSVDVLVTERDNDVIYQCHGTNEQLGQTVVDTVTLTVMCTIHDHTLTLSVVANSPTQKVNSPTRRLALPTTDSRFRGFPRRVRQTHLLLT